MDKDDENKPKTKRGKRTYTTTLIGAKEYNTEKIHALSQACAPVCQIWKIRSKP